MSAKQRGDRPYATYLIIAKRKSKQKQQIVRDVVAVVNSVVNLHPYCRLGALRWHWLRRVGPVSISASACAQRTRALGPCFPCQIGLLCGPCQPILFLALGPWCNLGDPPLMRRGSSLNGRGWHALIECEDLTVDGKCGFFSTSSSWAVI
jgi:hypothetical protein